MEKYIFLIVLLLAFSSDMKERKITNRLVLITIFTGSIYTVIEKGIFQLIPVCTKSIIVFGIFLIPYAMGIIGAGDIKLYMASCFWLDYEQVLMFIVYSVIVGMILSSIYLAKNQKFIKTLKKTKQSIICLINGTYFNKEQEDIKKEDRKHYYPFTIAMMISYVMILLQDVVGRMSM